MIEWRPREDAKRNRGRLSSRGLDDLKSIWMQGSLDRDLWMRGCISTSGVKWADDEDDEDNDEYRV